MPRKNTKLVAVIAAVLVLSTVAWGIGRHFKSVTYTQTKDSEVNDQNAADEEAEPGEATTVTPQDLRGTPGDTSALGGYNVLIADRGNNRIIEVTPDKKIVWEYDFNLPKKGLGADDAFFTDNGAHVVVNLEEYHVIELIDYQTKQVVWSYGTPGKPGSADGLLNTPDDAYKLPNGDLTVADIKNCRVIEIAPDKHIVRQHGLTGHCSNNPGYLNKPNGDTPIAGGHTLISNIVGRNLIELDQDWKQVFTMLLPVRYPSDPQLTKAGNVLISDYSSPGQIVEVSRQGNIVWQFSGAAGEAKMNKPSLAIELPNGNILANDDLNHRVIAIDKTTKKIVWQYGVLGKPGSGQGQLNVPDGVDIIKRETAPASTIGSITRHVQGYINKNITVSGYMLAQHGTYAIFSDENGGAIGVYDLPVVGPGIDKIVPGQKYLLQGVFKYKGLTASNGNPYHLELSQPPQPIK